MSNRSLRAAGAAFLLAGALAALGDELARYDGHKLVRVTLRTQADLDQMLAISQDHWSCSIGLGVAPFRVSPEQMPALELSGLAYAVIDDNIQHMLDAEQLALQQRGPWFENYHPYADVVAQLDALADLRPDLTARFSAGLSIENRTIEGIRITGTNGVAGKPGVLFNGCQHAREWIAVMVPMYIADYLIRNYDSDPQAHFLLDTLVVYVIPIVNPDGYSYTWTNTRLWRKNRRDNGNGTFGVDTNRNWGFQWGGPGSSGNSNSETYRGSAPFSEPETQRLRDFMLAHGELAAHIDFHSYGQLILSPWGYELGEPAGADGGSFRLLDEAVQQAIFEVHGLSYTEGPIGSTLYLAAGSVVDWAYGAAGLLSMTIELRPTDDDIGFVLPPSEIVPTCEENLAAALAMLDYVASSLSIELPDGLPDATNAGQTTNLNVTVRPLAAELLPGSARQFVRVGGSGPFTMSPLQSLGGLLYQASLPAANCGRTIQFYFEAETSDGELVRLPAAAPGEVYSVAVIQNITLFADDMEQDRGWTAGQAGDNASSGAWGRMDPQETAAQPGDDHTAAPGVTCWVTDGRAGTGVGSFDVDNGHTTLISPAIDLTSAGDPHISYWRWYSNVAGSAPNADVFRVDITSNAGGSWTNVETIGPAGPETFGGWIQHEFRVADFVTLPGTVQLRFVAEDAGEGSIVEAAVDDFLVADRECDTTPCVGDANGDGIVNLSDLAIVLSVFGSVDGDPDFDPNADFDDSGTVDLSDLAALLSVFGGACP